jgi:hypothetical protein
MTPNKMMLRREINLPSELIFKNVREELFENEEQYVTSLRNNINIGRHPSKWGCIVQPVHWPKVCKE